MRSGSTKACSGRVLPLDEGGAAARVRIALAWCPGYWPLGDYFGVMQRPVAALAAVSVLTLTGCAAQEAMSAEPTVGVSAPAPRPSAAPGLASRGPAEVVHSVDTTDRVVFLTIDDGLHPDPRLLEYLRADQVPVTVFLTTGTVGDWQYWKDMGQVASIQNHTVVHSSLPPLGQSGAQSEICGANRAISQGAGQVPWMLRPPYGEYNPSTLAAAGRCGLDWVVHWSVTLPGKRLRFQAADGRLKPGDIILTHFREDLVDVLPEVVARIRKRGFEIGRLEDYLTPRAWPDDAAGSDDVQQTQGTSTESRAERVQS